MKQLAYFGNKVVSLQAFAPAVEKNIRIHIRNVYNENNIGSVIDVKADSECISISTIGDITNFLEKNHDSVIRNFVSSHTTNSAIIAVLHNHIEINFNAVVAWLKDYGINTYGMINYTKNLSLIITSAHDLKSAANHVHNLLINKKTVMIQSSILGGVN
jgi:aspartokinase